MYRPSNIIWRLAGLVVLAPCLMGFVLLRSEVARLPVSPESPTLTFNWDGKAPSISEKEKFEGGKYADLQDKEFMEAVLSDAMGIWNDVPGSYVKLAFNEGNAVEDPEDKEFSIVTKASKNLTTAAYANPQFDPEDSSRISDCDVNIADHKVTAKGLAFTIAHELGHCLGLGHAHTNYQAIMSYARTSQALKLGADDKAGIIFLYPDPAYGDGKPKELVCGAVGGKRGLDSMPRAASARDAGGYDGKMGLIFLLLGPLVLALFRAPTAKSTKEVS